MALTKKQQLEEVLQAAIDAYDAGRVDQAVEHLAQRASSFPRAARLWGYLGFLYGEAGEHAQAVRAFRKTATISPHSEKASLGLFHSLWNIGKTDAAFDEMRRFVKSNDSPRYRQLIRDMLAEAPSGRSTPRESLVVA
jgi:tetratricopeptide (TPR) repeat protein